MKKYFYFVIPAAAVIACSFFLLSPADYKINDLFLHILPPLKENKNVVLINIDDSSIKNVGTFPWPRDVMADSIVYLREMGAQSVVFDLSYPDKSPQKINPDYVNKELPEYVDYEFKKINDSVSEVLDSFGNKTQESAAAAKYNLITVNNQVKEELETSISYITRDMDVYFAGCLKLFGNSYLPLTMFNRYGISDVDKTYLSSHIALTNITDENDTRTPVYETVQPAVGVLLKNAESAGFVNIDPDSDGSLRRINLVAKYDGRYYGQLIFVSLLRHLGNPRIIINNSYIILENARISDTLTGTIRIPRGEDGKVILKFPHSKYENYNGISAWNIYRVKLLEAEFIANLSKMKENGFFSIWENSRTPVDLYQETEYIREELYSGEAPENGMTFDLYRRHRNDFFDAAGKFLNGGHEKKLMEKAGMNEELKKYIEDYFTECRNEYGEILAGRQNIRAKVNDAICIIGTCATSTTDFGLTAYEDQYPNVGIHATVANMILNRDFADDSPWWISVLIAAVLCFSYCLFARKQNTAMQLFFGLIMLVSSTGSLLLFFLITKKYVGVIVPFSSMSVTFVAMIIYGFITAVQEKYFLRSAFGRYLSSEVINEIIKDPSKLNLGGESRDMTAFFTDIRGFSTISERLTPIQLVNLLNHYLTDMSDIILNNKGTIDKFEGDAIIAFFGAPVHLENHAELACRAAIEIKRKEEELNRKILAEGESPLPIFTRIGINTGEIVVGNMGTSNKMNYTMMGNAVNLASRLEGINKQYNTGGIIISEHTRNRIGNKFIVRSLDRVRVVGMETPVRLYELLAESMTADAVLSGYVIQWEMAIKMYERKMYGAALDRFEILHKEKPEDLVVLVYTDRCLRFIAVPPEADWDGIINFTTK